MPSTRFERVTPGLGILCSIHLSYEGVIGLIPQAPSSVGPVTTTCYYHGRLSGATNHAPKVRDREMEVASRSPWRVADRLDVVAVQVEDESAVVVRMVLRPQAWRPIVPATGPQGGLVESAHRGPTLDHEGDVHRRVVLPSLPTQNSGLPSLPKPQAQTLLAVCSGFRSLRLRARQGLLHCGAGAAGDYSGDGGCAEMIDDHASPPLRSVKINPTAIFLL
jgi:hypothetical protein